MKWLPLWMMQQLMLDQKLIHQLVLRTYLYLKVPVTCRRQLLTILLMK